MQTNIIVRLVVDGIHSWPECPIEEVSFLRSPHRHMFHIECVKEVMHDDRDVEIIQLKHEILSYLKAKYYSEEKRAHLFGRLSCESIARELLTHFGLNRCSVLEDNENGAEVIK